MKQKPWDRETLYKFHLRMTGGFWYDGFPWRIFDYVEGLMFEQSAELSGEMDF